MILFAPALCYAALTNPTCTIPQASNTPKPKARKQNADLVNQINRGLHLRPDQVEPVDAIVRTHQRNIGGIYADTNKKRSQKDQEAGDELGAMYEELKPVLTKNQLQQLDDLLYGLFNPGPHAKIAVDFSDFMPSSATTRSIFGRSITAFGLGFGGDERVGQRSRFGFGVDFFDMPSDPNKLFVISPQATYEYRVPITPKLYGFALASAGPAYMDYTYDLPSGQHVAAKRGGLDGSLELGAQWGPLRFGVEYRAFTQPSGLNFDGIELTAALTVLRF